MLTTSYPRSPDDPAGRFVADAVEHVRERRRRGRGRLAGVVPALRARLRARDRREHPRAAVARCCSCRSFSGRFAARRRRATAISSTRTGSPRARSRRRCGSRSSCRCGGRTSSSRAVCPGSCGWILRRARLVIAASSFLADEARALGAREVRVVPSGVAIPPSVGPPEEPPHVLYVGRLSAEKGVLELVEAARGLPLRVVGDGPLRARVPSRGVRRAGRARARGTSAPRSSPRRRAARATASSRARRWRGGDPSLRAAVGGLLDAVEDGVTGLLVPPGDVAALRAALERLLGDAELRARLGAAARERGAAGVLVRRGRSGARRRLRGGARMMLYLYVSRFRSRCSE